MSKPDQKFLLSGLTKYPDAKTAVSLFEREIGTMLKKGFKTLKDEKATWGPFQMDKLYPFGSREEYEVGQDKGQYINISIEGRVRGEKEPYLTISVWWPSDSPNCPKLHVQFFSEPGNFKFVNLESVPEAEVLDDGFPALAVPLTTFDNFSQLLRKVVQAYTESWVPVEGEGKKAA